MPKEMAKLLSSYPSLEFLPYIDFSRFQKSISTDKKKKKIAYQPGPWQTIDGPLKLSRLQDSLLIKHSWAGYKGATGIVRALGLITMVLLPYSYPKG